jgi:SAM-dependent methyltransferase
MTRTDPPPRLYGELAGWWPLISPPEEYAGEAEFVAELLISAEREVREVLELGSGGGHMASHLRGRFEMTLVDRSPEMLAISRRLNPSCAHLDGDMRTVRLGRDFDAVLVHDAIDYMRTPEDLRAALDTAFAHTRPGGVALFVPDDVAETFRPSTDHGGADGPDGRGVRYLEWIHAPEPGTTEVRADYALMLRDADGTVRLEHDEHRWGVFPRGVWMDLPAQAGFTVQAVTEVTDDDRPPRELFLARRPPAG